MAKPVRNLKEYLDPEGCPRERPPLEVFHHSTRALHQAIDEAARRTGVPYVHPEDPSLQLDMLGSRHMVDWQEKKAAWVLASEKCWSDLHQFYARYGSETTRDLITRVKEMERARGVILTDCGMQAVALAFDILARPGGHAVLFRGVYNKTRRYLEWLANRLQIRITLIHDGDYEAAAKAICPETFLVFAETYTNPLMRAIDPVLVSRLARTARKGPARNLRLILDNTIVTPWGLQRPLLEFEGVDVIVASGTKALAGQDRDLWGYIASNNVDFLNEVMDLQAARGGALDWRRARAILKSLDLAKEHFERRCRNASEIARFLARHPQVESVFHTSLPDHPDRAVIDRHYRLPGSIVSFRVRGADEDGARRFADVLATSVVPRYAGSFDGLATKINHHRTVSEYFTPEEDLKETGIDRVLRLAAGLESPEDVTACLNWALWHYENVSEEQVLQWQRAREDSLGIRAER